MPILLYWITLSRNLERTIQLLYVNDGLRMAIYNIQCLENRLDGIKKI